jgi:hypothetical protein
VCPKLFVQWHFVEPTEPREEKVGAVVSLVGVAVLIGGVILVATNAGTRASQTLQRVERCGGGAEGGGVPAVFASLLSRGCVNPILEALEAM